MYIIAFALILVGYAIILGLKKLHFCKSDFTENAWFTEYILKKWNKNKYEK